MKEDKASPKAMCFVMYNGKFYMQYTYTTEHLYFFCLRFQRIKRIYP